MGAQLLEGNGVNLDWTTHAPLCLWQRVATYDESHIVLRRKCYSILGVEAHHSKKGGGGEKNGTPCPANPPPPNNSQGCLPPPKFCAPPYRRRRRSSNSANCCTPALCVSILSKIPFKKRAILCFCSWAKRWRPVFVELFARD